MRQVQFDGRRMIRQIDHAVAFLIADFDGPVALALPEPIGRTNSQDALLIIGDVKELVLEAGGPEIGNKGDHAH